jgi:hypothetical protein
LKTKKNCHTLPVFWTPNLTPAKKQKSKELKDRTDCFFRQWLSIVIGAALMQMLTPETFVFNAIDSPGQRERKGEI